MSVGLTGCVAVGLGLPCVITRGEIQLLQGMAAVYGQNYKKESNPFQDILDILKKHDSIRLRAEY